MNYSNSQRAGVILYLTALLFGAYLLSPSSPTLVNTEFLAFFLRRGEERGEEEEISSGKYHMAAVVLFFLFPFATFPFLQGVPEIGGERGGAVCGLFNWFGCWEQGRGGDYRAAGASFFS